MLFVASVATTYPVVTTSCKRIEPQAPVKEVPAIQKTGPSDDVWEPFMENLRRYKIHEYHVSFRRRVKLEESDGDPKFYEKGSTLTGYDPYISISKSYFEDKDGKRVLKSTLEPRQINSLYHEFVHSYYHFTDKYSDSKESDTLYSFVKKTGDEIYEFVSKGEIAIYT